MRITRHAVNNYLDRVLEIKDGNASKELREYAAEEMRKAVIEPEYMYRSEGEKDPIAIRNGCAVPITIDNNERVVPTVYRAETFKRKINKNGHRQSS